MKPVEFEGQTHRLEAPAGWDQKAARCAALPVQLGEITAPGGQVIGRSFTSYWRPTAEELERLAAGACIGLQVVASGQPPVALFVEAVKVRS